MQCLISGLETNNKVNSQPIHEDVMSMVADMKQDNPKLSTNDCLKEIARMLFTDIKNKLENGEVPHE